MIYTYLQLAGCWVRVEQLFIPLLFQEPPATGSSSKLPLGTARAATSTPPGGSSTPSPGAGTPSHRVLATPTRTTKWRVGQAGGCGVHTVDMVYILLFQDSMMEHFLDKIHACHLSNFRGLKALIVFVSEFENILFLIHKLTTILVPCINVGLEQINHLKYTTVLSHRACQIVLNNDVSL